MKKLKAIHPGKILIKEFMEPLGISQYKLAKDIGVPVTRINQIVKSKRSLTVDTCIRLGTYFGTSFEFWVNLQAKYNLELLTQKDILKIQKQILLNNR